MGFFFLALFFRSSRWGGGEKDERREELQSLARATDPLLTYTFTHAHTHTQIVGFPPTPSSRGHPSSKKNYKGGGESVNEESKEQSPTRDTPVWCRRRRLFFFASPRLRKKRWEMPLARSLAANAATAADARAPSPRVHGVSLGGCSQSPGTASSSARLAHTAPAPPPPAGPPPPPASAQPRARPLAVSRSLSPLSLLHARSSSSALEDRPLRASLCARSRGPPSWLSTRSRGLTPLPSHLTRRAPEGRPFPFAGSREPLTPHPPRARSRGPPLPLMHH